jgi:hypothetical protein
MAGWKSNKNNILEKLNSYNKTVTTDAEIPVVIPDAGKNARFDVNALNNTIRYITKSEKRFFFPRNTEIWDTYKGALKTVCKQKAYISFCKRNGYMTKHKIPRVKATAEVLYKFLSGNHDFIEEHQGLDDTIIEAKILVWILRQHSKKEYIRLYA